VRFGISFILKDGTKNNRMILGIDASTTKVGIALLDNKNNICLSDVLIFKKLNILEHKAEVFESYIKSIQIPDKIYIEEPVVSFSGGNMAKTIAILQRWNGMVCYSIYKTFNITPVLVNVRSARSKLGIKTPFGKNKTTREKKQPAIDFVYNRYKNTNTPFLYKMTKNGNPAGGTDDRADAVVLALAGPLFA